MPEDNFDLEETLHEPFPRTYEGKIFLRIRTFKTLVRATQAKDLIKERFGLVRIVHRTAYGGRSYRLYANANGKPLARDIISEIAHTGSVWSDWE